MSGSGIVVVLLLTFIIVMYVRRIAMARMVTNYSPSELADLLKRRRDLVVLDVRTRNERANSGIKGSMHIPLHELTARAGELEEYRNGEIVCYCQSGSRSVVAAFKLRRLGFQAANLKGGIAEWNFQNR